MNDEMLPTTRDRILQAAIDLLAQSGRDAVSTRAVSAAAGVQPQTIYRQFGDMQGLLDAVARHGFATYLGTKLARERVEDPVEDLRHGWDLHINFGITHPSLYALMYGDPRPGVQSSAAGEAYDVLRGLVEHVAAAGRLRFSVDDAALMIEASGVGVVLALIAMPDTSRNLTVSEMTREAILAAITTDAAGDGEDIRAGQSRVANRAVALKAVLPDAAANLTAGEASLLGEWLDRLSRISS